MKLLILNQVINKVLNMISTSNYITYTMQLMHVGMSICQQTKNVV